MRIACLPGDVPYRKKADVRFVLYDQAPEKSIGAAGTTLIRDVRRLGLTPNARAWDLLSIALGIVSADDSCQRSASPDGWTRQIELTVAVSDKDFWDTQTEPLAKMLGFLSGDIWRMRFVEGGLHPAPGRNVVRHRESKVCLLSGGMDSLIGASDLAAKGTKPLLVSRIEVGDSAKQQRFAQQLGCGHVQLGQKIRVPGNAELSQRARSVIFLAFGVLTATSLESYKKGKVIPLYVPENGFISLNSPLTPFRIGSLSTRTTHPFFLNKFQGLLDAAEINVSVQNRYQLRTKGEMMVRSIDQSMLKQNASKTTSCGRYRRMGYRHCGRCVPCLVRRSAFHQWGNRDRTGYVYNRLSIKSSEYRDFDDVRSVCFAIERVRSQGLDDWVGGSLNMAQLGNLGRFRSVAKRGLAELEAFLEAKGAL